MRHVKSVFGVALVASAAFAASAQAASWQAPVRVSAVGEKAYLSPRVAMDANGDTIVAWLRVTSFNTCPCTVRAAYRPAGGSFGAPVDVSPQMPASSSAEQVFVAMDAAGEAIVAWNGGQDPANSSLYDSAYAAIKPPGGSFGAPELLVQPSGTNMFGVLLTQLAVDGAGDAIAGISGEQAYTGAGGSTGDQTIAAEVVRRPAGGAFDSARPQILSDGQHTADLRALAMSPDGKAVVAIRSDVDDEANPTTPQANSLITMTSSAPGAAFGNSHTIETVTPTTPGGQPSVDTGDITRPDAAINDSGDYVVIYDRDDPNGQPFSFDSTPKVTIDGGAGTSIHPTGATNAAADGVAIDATGHIVVAGSDGQGNGFEATGTAAGGVGSPTALSMPPAGTFANAANLSGANGQILYAYDGAGSSANDVDASIGSPTGSFPSPATLSSGDDTFTFGVSGAIDKTGDAAVGYLGGTSQLEVHVALSSASSSGGGSHTLTVHRAGTGSGAVTSSPAGISCGSTCSHAYANGTPVTLSASPASGSKFAGWSGGGCGSTASCKVTLASDVSVTATFTKTTRPAPPNTVITKKAINRRKHNAKFRFKATGSAATGFQCSLVKASKHKKSRPAYHSCTSPKSYSHLAHGSYTFYVRARGAGGTDPTPATAKFKL
jgi:hypothetical protein